MKNITLIVAISENNVIGKDNQLPWHLPNDLRFFKATTTGKAILMGRKCFESIGKPLPDRTNIVLTRQTNFSHEGVLVAHHLEAALQLCPPDTELVVIGGAEIYQLALPLVKKMYITHVKANIEGNVFFPDINWQEWQEVNRQNYAADEKHAYPFDIATYERKL
jgi:dihydrofolate reductase